MDIARALRVPGERQQAGDYARSLAEVGRQRRERRAEPDGWWLGRVGCVLESLTGRTQMLFEQETDTRASRPEK